MHIDETAYLEHYGILRKSGRYPWGSGGTQAARNKSFLDHVDDLRKQGLGEVEIAKGFGMSTTELRAVRSIAKNAQKQAEIGQAQRLKDKGLSNVAIGERMGLNESSVRALLVPGQKDKADVLQTTATMLKEQVAQKRFVDVGTGVEHHVGVSSTKLSTAVAVLKEEGYEVHSIPVQQLGTGQNTYVKVLAPPGTTWGDVMRGKDQIQQINSRSDDGGRSYLGLLPPIKVNPDRIGINYGNEGGAQADGVIFVRPGVKDVSLGSAQYAQVRIAVGDGHFLKGMAMYKDDLPKGHDLVFNTNKENTGNKTDVFKEVTGDPDNPFGAIVDQIKAHDEHGNPHVTSAMNIVNEEGDWSKWSRSLSSQMLSKQSPKLAKTQLDMTYESRIKEFDEISSLTNPTVRKRLLETFGDDAESASVHLKAAALPRQGSHVILPISSMPESQVYAPNYRDGERVVLIRYPHGGTFEIPELTVNNSNPEAIRVMGGARDAVGIHPKVAERLSGADFDGDTVLVIPNNANKVIATPALEGLKGFDPRASYKAYDGMPKISPRTKQVEMGVVSNLITDMTIKGAPSSEIARAVRHSMVVIDSEKHNLNYKQSAIDNNIAQLKAKYQGGARAGAATLISRASAEIRVPERKARTAAKGGPIDKTTGARVFEPTNKTFVNPQGKTVIKTTKTQRLAEATDAHLLSSGTPIEGVYAEHSNRLKALADRAHKDSVNTPPATYSPSAKKTYVNEVAALNARLNIALRNAPLERQAQVIAGTVVRMKKDANPDMDSTQLKKIKAQALNEARIRTGAKKEQIVITQDQWNAIQAGAISDSKLSQILSNADMDVVKQLATPRIALKMTNVKTQRAQAMLASGFTRSEVADALGVSLTTLDTATNG